jgi:hypothetical protein
MKKTMHRISERVLLLWLALCVVSCSVKEDRTQCPCILEVAFMDTEQTENPVTITGWGNDSMVFEDCVTVADCRDGYRRSVPRGMLHFGAVQGVAECGFEGRTVWIPQGCQCDSLYSFCDYVDCTGETARTAVDFHKQFATVNILVSSDSFVAEDYSFIVESGTAGIDLLDCKGVAGSFIFQPQVETDNCLRFRLPRQCDYSLSLKVEGISGSRVTFPLGAYIQTIGYDWAATDLPDIFITLDIVCGQVSVGVAQWEDADSFELSQIEI